MIMLKHNKTQQSDITLFFKDNERLYSNCKDITLTQTGIVFTTQDNVRITTNLPYLYSRYETDNTFNK